MSEKTRTKNARVVTALVLVLLAVGAPTLALPAAAEGPSEPGSAPDSLDGCIEQTSSFPYFTIRPEACP